MVVAEVQRSLDGVTDLIENRELGVAAAVAGLSATGMAFNQEIADQVMPMINRPVDPSSPADLGISAIVKLAATMAIVALGVATGGFGLAIAGGLSVGMLTSMGTDLIDVLQRGGLPGMSPSRSPTRVSPSRPASPGRGSQGRAIRSSTAASVDSGAYR